MAHITKVMFLLFFLGASFVYVAPSQAAYSLLCGTAIYVDDSFVGVSDGTSGSPYTTIAAAVAVASAGDVICVNDGTYASTNINQQVTLLGPNAGFNANDPADITASNPTRITEAVVNGTFGLQANNIIVDGFTFSGFALGIAQQVSPFTSMQVLNNNFLNGSFAINFNFGAVFPLNRGLLIERITALILILPRHKRLFGCIMLMGRQFVGIISIVGHLIILVASIYLVITLW